jgi:hypothetical protein
MLNDDDPRSGSGLSHLRAKRPCQTECSPVRACRRNALVSAERHPILALRCVFGSDETAMGATRDRLSTRSSSRSGVDVVRGIPGDAATVVQNDGAGDGFIEDATPIAAGGVDTPLGRPSRMPFT